MSLEGKVAVVTGASSGLDKSIALALGHQGAYAAGNYHSPPEAAPEVVAAREMVRTKSGGTFINISPVHEDLPFPGFTPYCAAKGALRMMCRNIAPELAPYGINVVNVAPGAIATPINRATLDSAEKTA